MRKNELSIIIVSFNTKKLLKQCLDSLQTHCSQAQIIVVDNASRDGSPQMVQEEFPEVRLVQSDKNLGFAKANNLGIAQATGEYILLLNSDTVVIDDTLQKCLDYMKENPALGAASPALLGADGIEQVCQYHLPTFQGYLREALWLDAHTKKDATHAKWLAGTALMIRRVALNEIGGLLDDSHFMYWEDADISMRLLKNGWKLGVYQQGHIIHYGGASGGGADATRRADLHAWYIYGKHHWFQKHRPLWEAHALWFFEAMNIGRQFLRGCINPKRRGEWKHCLAVANVLGRLVRNGTPPIP